MTFSPRLRIPDRVVEEFLSSSPRLLVLRALAALLPTDYGARSRAALMRIFGLDVGHGCIVMGMPTLLGGRAIHDNLHIGDGVLLGVECLIDCCGSVRLDQEASVGPRVQLITGAHEIGSSEKRLGALQPRPIHVGTGAWLGAGAIILPGVAIGAGSVVASGAVVTEDVPPNQLVAGVPAKPIRTLDEP